MALLTAGAAAMLDFAGAGVGETNDIIIVFVWLDFFLDEEVNFDSIELTMPTPGKFTNLNAS